MPWQAAAAFGTLATSLLLGGVAAVGEEAPPPSRRVRLELIRATPVADEALEAALEEAAAIWAPHGVVVLAASAVPAVDRGEGEVTIKVLLRDAPANRVDGRTTSGYRALASLVFLGPTDPGRVMFVSLRSARQTARAAKLERWPAAMQERLAARLLGRAIAHELGHYLLATREHSERGLMRAAFDRRDVLADDLSRFRLEPEQAAALHGRRTSAEPTRRARGEALPGENVVTALRFADGGGAASQRDASATAALEMNPIIISSVDSSPNVTVCVESKP
jgi:hypothetical protein